MFRNFNLYVPINDLLPHYLTQTTNIVYWICVKLKTNQFVQKDQLLSHETLKIK